MQTYYVGHFSDELGDYFILFAIDQDILEIDDDNKLIRLKKFLIANVPKKDIPIKIRKTRNEDSISWKWKSDSTDDPYFVGLIFESECEDKLIEFEDDEDAILWFKLNY
jgi:hypothetical protein